MAQYHFLMTVWSYCYHPKADYSPITAPLFFYFYTKVILQTIETFELINSFFFFLPLVATFNVGCPQNKFGPVFTFIISAINSHYLTGFSIVSH